MSVTFTDHSFNDAMRFLYDRTNYETFTSIPYSQLEWNLKRLSAFLDYIGRPDRKMKVVHVAGTKGKGSVCFLLEKILRDAGLKTGLFTSPHLHSVLERFVINGTPCSDWNFTETVFELREQWDQFEQHEKEYSIKSDDENRLTFFEWSVLIALVLFARSGVDIAIMEVGLGGRFDATNICWSEVSVITSISYDHLDQLGATLPEIAFEKAGIIKEKTPVVCGVEGIRFLPQNKEVPEHYIGNDDIESIENVIRAVATEKNAPLTIIREISDFVRTLSLNICGVHQQWNVETVLAVLNELKQKGIYLTNDQIRHSLNEVRLTARAEIVCRHPLLLFDGAHNRASCAALVDSIREIQTRQSELVMAKKSLLLGVSHGKDIEGMLAELIPFFDEIIVTGSGTTRALPPEELYEKVVQYTRKHRSLNEKIKIHCRRDYSSFLREYFSTNRNVDNLLVVSGSFYLVAAVSEYYRKNETSLKKEV